MPAISLTPRQRDLLAFIDGYQFRTGRSPSLVEMKEGLHFAAISNVRRLLTQLVDRGWIRRTPNEARSIVILRRAPLRLRGKRYRFIPITAGSARPSPVLGVTPTTARRTGQCPPPGPSAAPFVDRASQHVQGGC